MQPKAVVSFICTVFLAVGSFAVPIPVTGDSSAVWTAIDISPTGDTMQAALLPTEEGEMASASPDTTDVTSETPVQYPVKTPVAKTDPVQKVPSQPAEKPEKEATGKPSTEKDSAAAATVLTTENQGTDTVQAAEADSAAPPPIVPGTLIITSIPDSAQITINDVGVGSTPYNVSGFYPGFYDIVVTIPGFLPCTKSIELKPGGTEFITASLTPESGGLYVVSTPENATVSINDTVVGMTPYTSKPLSPGIYRLSIELPGYVTYSEQLGISSNLTDTLQIPLQPEMKPGLFANVGFKNSQTVRRISFGAVCLSATAAGFILNTLASGNIKKEQTALEEYREAKLSEAEYTRRYEKYHDLTEATGRYTLFRTICYGLGIAGGVGFTVSIFY